MVKNWEHFLWFLVTNHYVNRLILNIYREERSFCKRNCLDKTKKTRGFLILWGGIEAVNYFCQSSILPLNLCKGFISKTISNQKVIEIHQTFTINDLTLILRVFREREKERERERERERETDRQTDRQTERVIWPWNSWTLCLK